MRPTAATYRTPLYLPSVTDSVEGRVEWFGQPDGEMGDFDGPDSDLIKLPDRFGGIARDPADARVRVVAGALGAGKSLFLRRMQAIQSNSHAGSTYAARVHLSTDLSTEDIARFRELNCIADGNTENWKIAWRRAIVRGAVSLIRFTPVLRDKVPTDLMDHLTGHKDLLGNPGTPRKIPHELKQIIASAGNRNGLRRYLQNEAWQDIEGHLSQALMDLPPLFLYIDDIDKNYRWAPTLWAQCQRGLFYAVMDLLRDSGFKGRLHVVVAIRDVTMATIRASEHAPRYLDHTRINTLHWNRESARYLFEEKVSGLPERLFSRAEDRSVASWLGMSTISNSRPNAGTEEIGNYLLRHTRLVPRPNYHG